ncbi:MAG TPA: hypothetical protein VFF52_15965 [Isosphaeraceae bacterium]|nr:hypothetical protein [Isosphaeraceae bacterium]
MVWRVVLNPRWPDRAALAGWLAVLALVGAGETLGAQDLAREPAPARPPAPGRTEGGDGGPAAPVPPPAAAHVLPGPPIEAGAATVTTRTPAVAGARVTLELDRGPVAWSHFFWTQVEGPPVTIEDPTAPSIRVVVPPGAQRLGFLFVASSREVVRVFRVTLPIQQGPAMSLPGSGPARAGAFAAPRGSARARANAGDDQVGLVGHRVTLNGSRSLPADGKAVRWVQVSGPVAVAPEQQGLYYSFIPGTPGVYRFVLVVSADGEISEPDEVAVVVGSPPAGTLPGGAAAAYAPPAQAPQPAAPAWASAPDQLLATVLPNLPGSPRVAGDVADILEAICQRSSLYSSFGELQSELSRRLDVVVPTDPGQRSSWIQNVFLPLTAATANELLATGVDIRTPQGVQQPLTPAQQERIRDHLQKLAKAFRAFATSR